MLFFPLCYHHQGIFSVVVRGDECTRDDRRTKKISLGASTRYVKKEANVKIKKKSAYGVFYHVRLAACHDLTLRYLLVSVSLGGKSISLRRYCENCEMHQRASNRGRVRYAPCVANTTRAFRGRSIFLFFDLSLSSSPPLSPFFCFDRGPQAIWILIEKPGFMLLCYDRDCSRANSIIRARDNTHQI